MGSAGFFEPRDGYFEGGDRKTYLEQLRYPTRWPRRLMLVTGPDDVGKTSLYRRLAASLETNVQVARVNASVVRSGMDVVVAVARAFGLGGFPDAGKEALLQMIADHVEQRVAAGRVCLAMMDSAEFADAGAIEDLLKLMTRCSLRLVLFGTVGVVSKIEPLARLHELSWQEIRLSGFAPQDARDYLLWRFQGEAPPDSLPFTDEQVDEIVRASGGMPGAMDRLADTLLVDLKAAGRRNARSRFPVFHGVVLVSLIAGVVWLYRSAPNDETVDASPASPISPDRTVAAEANLAPAPTASPVPATAAEPVALTVPTIAPVVAVTPPVRPLTSDERDERWLLRQSGSAFTVQLVTFSSAKNAHAFVARQTEPDRFATYRLRRNDRELHAVLFGLFDSRDEAQRAAAGLKLEPGLGAPWVRPMEDVHAAIEPAVR